MLTTMLTTLDLDDDGLISARALAEQHHRSIDAVISELARRGLAPASPPAAVRKSAATAADLLGWVRERAEADTLLEHAVLDWLAAAQREPRRSPDRWAGAED